MEVKLFWSESSPGFLLGRAGSKGPQLEQEMNAWLAANPDIDIAHVQQSSCGGSFAPALWLVSVWFQRKPDA